MAPTKVIERAEPAVVTNGASPPLPASRLPRRLHVPILVIVSLCLRSALWQFASSFVGDELGHVSTRDGGVEHALSHLVYKIGVLWAGWTLRYDFIDITSLTVLSEAPYTYLLVTYYEVSTPTAAISVLIEIMSTALPTFLLRPRSEVHSGAPIPNRFLLNSFQVQSTTTLVAIAVYGVALWVGLKTGVSNLNTYLISYFELPTLEGAHNESGFSLAAKMLPVGWAAQAFLLNTSLGAQKPGKETSVKSFDPVSSTLSETFQHNYWSYSRRTKTLISQTVYAVLFIIANTVHRVLNLEGATATGAIGYAIVWALATVVTSGLYEWTAEA